MGGTEDRKLFVQHDAQWILSGRAGAGNILLFNNGTGRSDPPFSSVDEIVPPLNRDGSYMIYNDLAAGPKEPIWSYRADPPESMYSPLVSSAQRLSNGNTLICVGEGGRFLEIGAGGKVVWEYQNRHVEEREGRGGPGPGSVFRALRIPADHPGLAGLN